LLEYERADVGNLHYSVIGPKEFGALDTFWSDVESGRLQRGESRRTTRTGRTIWLHSSFAPVRDGAGRVVKIIEYAADITETKAEQADLSGQVAAIDKSHCVITFSIDGTIISANQAYLDALGYAFGEIEGRHHRMFVDPSFAHGPEYAKFWRELEQGRFQSGEYLRLAKGGRAVWLQATYSPIFDLDGRPIKIVKCAVVVTEERLRQADHQGQIAAIHKAQAVISFELDGTIIDANDNFLRIMGYRLSDVRGRHHRMFVDFETAESD
jgi:PAS domain S-box-containing protein